MQEIIIGLLILVVIILIQYMVAKKFEISAFQKGYDEEINSFSMCFFLGIVGYLYVIALPDLNANKTAEEREKLINERKALNSAVESSEKIYRCPQCNAIVIYGSECCPRCGKKIKWDK